MLPNLMTMRRLHYLLACAPWPYMPLRAIYQKQNKEGLALSVSCRRFQTRQFRRMKRVVWPRGQLVHEKATVFEEEHLDDKYSLE